MTFAIIAAVVPGLYGLHRLALWAESRGWIYYLRKRASGDALGTAFLELHSIAQPKTKHVLEARRQEKRENDDEGGPDKAGEGAGPGDVR
jgi:hypothetical protein